MDKGRQIDNIQNTNARFFDNYGKSGKTSTKISHPPGGVDHISLSWETNNNPEPKYTYGKKRFEQSNYYNYNNFGK